MAATAGDAFLTKDVCMSPLQYMIAQPDAIPPALKDLPHWVTWDPELVGDRWTKVLKNPRTGSKASSTNAATWSTLDHALKRNPSRVGFVLTKSGFLVIDLDHCVVDGIIEEWAWKIIRRIGSYAEISVSGTGVHIIIRGQLPPGRRRIGQIETYDDGRYVTVTGATIDGYTTMATDDGRVAAWYAETFPAKVPTPIRPRLHTETHLEDDDLLERARNARNGTSFVALYDHGDLSAHGNNHSAADQALMNRLAFWFGCDADRMEQRFTDSALGQREKWRARADYRRRTIDKAIQDCRETYSAQHNEPPPPLPPAEPEPIVAASSTSRSEPIADAPSCPAQLMAAQAEIIELKAVIAAREAVIARERELRKAAEARADRLAETNSKTLQILRNPDLSIGPRVTTFAVTLDLGARIANGEAPTEHGYRVPAVRIAEMTGQSEDTVARHLREVSRRGLIPKKLIREPAREVVDRGSGEITVVGARDANYIPVPEGNIINLIDRIIDYQRPELETGHGGIRSPQCPEHPEAGTIKRWTVECAECHRALDSGETHQAPNPAESSGGNLHPDTSVENPSLSGVKLPSERIRHAPKSSDRMMPSEPPLDEEPPDYWMPPDWEDDHRRVYGEIYQGVGS